MKTFALAFNLRMDSIIRYVLEYRCVVVQVCSVHFQKSYMEWAEDKTGIKYINRVQQQALRLW